MKTYTKQRALPYDACVVALGCFDGVHVGHQAVIGEAVREAAERGICSAVWTFREPPRNYFAPGSAPLITDHAEKKKQISRLGADVLLCIPFDGQIASLSPTDFFEHIIIRDLHASHVVCGYNYTFGKHGAGTAEVLRELCLAHGIGFTCMPQVNANGIAVSASAIRHAVEEGDVEKAALLLGRPFSHTSRIEDGQKLARRLGFPTVNQIPQEGLLMPRRGVYVSRVRIGRQTYYGISNVGIRPTVGKTQLCCETHIFDFCGDLYGKQLRVEFLHFLRSEVKFESLDSLQMQVQADIETAKQYLNGK